MSEIAATGGDGADTIPSRSSVTSSLFSCFCGHSHIRCQLSLIDAVVLSLLAIIVAAYFLPICYDGRIPGHPHSDLSTYWLWNLSYLGESLRNLRLPFWNPYVMAGSPFLGAGQSGLFYPPNWLSAIFSAGTTISILTVVHFWAGIAAMYFLMRFLGCTPAVASIPSLSFGFSGFAVLHWWQGHLVYIYGWPYTPLAVLLWLKMQSHGEHGRAALALRSTLLLATTLAIQFFSSHPLFTYFTVLLLVVLQTGWILFANIHRQASAALRGGLWLILALILCGALAAVQILPVYLYSRETIRAGAADFSYYTVGSQQLSELYCLASPWIFGGLPGGQNYQGTETMWEVMLYVGAGVIALLLLALILRRRPSPLALTLMVLAFISWVIALGENGIGYSFIHRLVPGLSFFRNPGRFSFLITFCLSLLSGIAVQQFVHLAKTQTRTFLRAIVISIFTLAIIATVHLVALDAQSTLFVRLMKHRLPMIAESQFTPNVLNALHGTFISNLLSGLAVMGATLGAAALLAHSRIRTLGAWPIAALLCAELMQFAWPYRDSFHPQSLIWPEAIRSAITSAGPLYRVASARQASDLSQGSVHSIRHEWGYEPVMAARYTKALAFSQGRVNRLAPQWMHTPNVTPLTNALGARFLLTLPDDSPTSGTWTPRMTAGHWQLHENPAALPRIQAIFHARKADDMIAEVNYSGFAPDKEVLLEGEDLSISPPSGGTGTVTVVKDEPETIVMKADFTGRGWVVVMDHNLPGWTTQVDGQTVPILRANAVGRAVEVPAGKHEITMTYHAPGFAAGAAVSGAAWILAIGLTAWFSLRKQAIHTVPAL